MSKAVKFKDKNEKCELIFKNIVGDLEKISFRNSSIIMTGNEEFILKPLFENESYLVNFNILTTILKTPTLLLKKNNIEFKLYPAINGLSIQEIYNNFDNIEIENISETFFILVLVDNIPKFYIKDEKISSADWLKVGISLEKNKIQIFLNNFITKYIFDFTTNKKTLIDIEYILDDSAFTLLQTHVGLVNDIELNTFSDDLIVLSESDYMDYVYTDYYTIRKCDSNCLSASPITFPELNDEVIFKPRQYSLSGEKVCTYESNKIDPVTNKKSDYCSKTCLTKINSDYPTPTDFKNTVIQSTHYKTQFSLNENPLLKNAIIDKDTCELVYTTFELVRPATRVANYIEYLRLETDFSSKTTSLYKNNSKLNWVSRMTAWKNVMNSSVVINVGDNVFSDSESEWLVNHNLSTYDIICHSFGVKNEMIYPDKQYPIDENNYMISWGKSSMGGFALLTKAIFVDTFEQLQTKPFVVIHNLHSSTEPDLVQMRNDDENKEREEPKEFIEDGSKLIVELLKTFNSNSTILINPADKMFYFRNKALEWNVKHDLDVLGVHPQIYNDQFEVIQPKEIFLIDKDNMKITFDVPQNGYLGLKKIGDPFWKNNIIEDIIEKDENGNYLGKFGLGDLTGINFDRNYGEYFYQLREKKKLQTDSPIWVPISSFQEKKEYYEFEFVINTNEYTDMNINEIGLFDKNGQLCFYSCGDDIYYPTEFSFRHKFIIYKEDLKRVL